MIRYSKRSARALDQASVLPRTVVSLVQSSVLGTSCWGNYAQCAQSAVGRRPVEIPPNPECCRQTIRAVGIAQACPCTMLRWLLFQEKKKWGPAPGCDRPFSSVRSATHSGLWDAVFPTETMCWRFWTLFYRLLYGLHSFLRRRRPRRTFLVTNISGSLEFVDQTSNGCSCWSFCTVRSTKPSLNLSKGQSIESPTLEAYSLFCGQHLSDYIQQRDKN